MGPKLIPILVHDFFRLAGDREARIQSHHRSHDQAGECADDSDLCPCDQRSPVAPQVGVPVSRTPKSSASGADRESVKGPFPGAGFPSQANGFDLGQIDGFVTSVTQQKKRIPLDGDKLAADLATVEPGDDELGSLSQYSIRNMELSYFVKRLSKGRQDGRLRRRRHV